MECERSGNTKCYGRFKPSSDGPIRCYGHYIPTLWRTLPVKQTVRERDAFCRTCGSTERLEIHHIFYPAVWGEELAQDLTLLCHDCHSAITSLLKEARYKVDPITAPDMQNTFVPRDTATKNRPLITADTLAVEQPPVTRTTTPQRRHMNFSELLNKPTGL